jgi:hypothetical protein
MHWLLVTEMECLSALGKIVRLASYEKLFKCDRRIFAVMRLCLILRSVDDLLPSLHISRIVENSVRIVQRLGNLGGNF